MQKIWDYVGYKKIWTSMDETTDIEGRYVVNFIIGTLKLENSGKIFLLHTDVLKKQIIQQPPKCLINLCLYYFLLILNMTTFSFFI